MKMKQEVKPAKISAKPEYAPKLGAKKTSKLDQSGDVKSKDNSVYVKAGIQDQKKQAGV